jgi:hypothetical protein
LIPSNIQPLESYASFATGRCPTRFMLKEQHRIPTNTPPSAPASTTCSALRPLSSAAARTTSSVTARSPTSATVCVTAPTRLAVPARPAPSLLSVPSTARVSTNPEPRLALQSTDLFPRRSPIGFFFRCHHWRQRSLYPLFC